MNAMELQLLIADRMRARERLVAQRSTQWGAAETFRAEACEPGHSSMERREMRFREIACRGICQRIDNELWAVDSELRKLKQSLAKLEEAADTKAAHDEFFNRVRQVVKTTNVVPLPFPADNTPEAA